MGAYSITGTNLLVIGGGKRWNLYEDKRPIENKVAGPFTSRAEAIRSATADKRKAVGS